MSCILHMLTLSKLMMTLLLSAFSSCPAYHPFVSPFLFFRDSCQLSQQATPCCSHIALRLESFSSSVQTQKELSSSAYKNAHLFFFFKKYVLLSFVVHHASQIFSPAAAGLMSRPKYYSSLVIFFHDLLLLLYTGCCLLSVGHFTREQEENAFEISPFLCLLLLTSKHVQTTVRVCTSIQTTQRVYIQLQYVMLNDVVAGLRFRRFRLNSQNMYIKSSVFLFFFFSYCCCVTQSILLLHFALSLRVRVYNAPRETICIKKGQYILHTHT